MDASTFLAATDESVVRATQKHDGEWSVDVLLRGKGVSCLAGDPQNQNIIYSGTKDQGVWRSENSGLTWTSCGLEDVFIKSLAVNALHPNIIYAGTKAALMFISTDGANSWTELRGFREIPNRWWWFSPAELPDMRPYVIAIAPSPSEPDVLLAGIEFGAVVRSEDNGHTWSGHRKGALRDCHSLKFHDIYANRVYQAGGTGGGVAYSSDGGRTFQRKKKGLAEHYGVVCAADPVDPDTWYVNVAASPFKAHGKNPETYLYRTAGGSEWQSIGWEPHPIKATPMSLVTLKNRPGHLYAGLKTGEIWYSHNYGDQWEKMPFSLERITSPMLIL